MLPDTFLYSTYVDEKSYNPSKNELQVIKFKET